MIRLLKFCFKNNTLFTRLCFKNGLVKLHLVGVKPLAYHSRILSVCWWTCCGPKTFNSPILKNTCNYRWCFSFHGPLVSPVKGGSSYAGAYASQVISKSLRYEGTPPCMKPGSWMELEYFWMFRGILGVFFVALFRNFNSHQMLQYIQIHSVLDFTNL